MLARAGLGPLLGALVCGHDAAQPKPAPDPYLLAARKLGANTALVVEDSKAGVASGRAAGFDVLRIPEPARLPELLLAALDELKIRTSQVPPPV